ncbi:ABC transporter permease [Candidatus Atribacteria bacterium HGW-Atribacteria-1]|nr:MAG: ABC transporter permease [Candidatus Atribacteria bacterium HGW-Atribacteria-1]
MCELLVKKNPKFMVSLGIVLFIVAIGVIGPLVTVDPLDFVGIPFEKPSLKFILGTDSFGRDIFAQLCTGLQTSLKIGVFASSIAILIAFIVGGLGAYKGGLVDEGANFFVNIIMVFPMLPLLLILSAFFEVRSLWLVGMLIAITSWPWAARCMRSQILSLKEREFVDLARISGLKDIEIVIKEVLPNLLAYVFMVFVVSIGGAVVAEAGISMIGLGPTDVISLGQMLYWALLNESTRMGIWWWFIPPGLILTVFTVSLLVMHSAMDEVFNPRLRRR